MAARSSTSNGKVGRENGSAPDAVRVGHVILEVKTFADGRVAVTPTLQEISVLEAPTACELAALLLRQRVGASPS